MDFISPVGNKFWSQKVRSDDYEPSGIQLNRRQVRIIITILDSHIRKMLIDASPGKPDQFGLFDFNEIEILKDRLIRDSGLESGGSYMPKKKKRRES